MKFRALRGVCIGVDRHMKVGDVEDLDTATGQFLLSIGAIEKFVEPVQSESPKSAPELPVPEIKSVPEKSGKKEK